MHSSSIAIESKTNTLMQAGRHINITSIHSQQLAHPKPCNSNDDGGGGGDIVIKIIYAMSSSIFDEGGSRGGRFSKYQAHTFLNNLKIQKKYW